MNTGWTFNWITPSHRMEPSSCGQMSEQVRNSFEIGQDQPDKVQLAQLCRNKCRCTVLSPVICCTFIGFFAPISENGTGHETTGY